MRKWKVFAGICFLATVLCGCGSPAVKTEEEMQADLTAHKNFYHAQEVDIREFEVIKRQTNEEEKEDIIFVQLSAENENISGKMSYRLQYGLYEEGWILDNVTVYGDGENQITPKSEVGQAVADADVKAASEYAYTFQEKSVDLENGFCGYAYSYTTPDGCVGLDYYLSYEFNQETAKWEKVKGQESMTLLGETPQSVVDADMKAESEYAFSFAEKSVDLENGVCSFWYECTLEQKVRITHMRYRLDYRFDEKKLQWVKKKAEQEPSTFAWNMIEGTWTTTHAETNNIYLTNQEAVDRKYEMIISDVTDNTFAMKLYRDGELVLDKTDCKLEDISYTIWCRGAKVAFLQMTEDGFYFGDYFTVEAVFEKVNQ